MWYVLPDLNCTTATEDPVLLCEYTVKLHTPGSVYLLTLKCAIENTWFPTVH